MFLLPKQFLLWRRAVVLCCLSSELKTVWATMQPHGYGPPAAAWGQQGGEWGTSLAPCTRGLQDRAAGSLSGLCRQGWHNFFCLPFFLPWSCPSKTIPISSPHLVPGQNRWRQTLLTSTFFLSQVQAQPVAPYGVSDLVFTIALVLVVITNHQKTRCGRDL